MIRSSYNVSSITKNGTGDYTVNFATAMADSYYAFSIADNYPGNGHSFNYLTKTSSALRVAMVSQTGAVIDVSEVNVIIFGN